MQNGKDEKGKFAIGNNLGKGRGVSGRRKTLDIMDKLLSLAGNQEKLKEDWQRIFNEGPAKFWLRYAKDVLPPMTKDPRGEEEKAYTDEEIARGIDAVLKRAGKRINKQAAKDDSEVEPSSIEQSTN